MRRNVGSFASSYDRRERAGRGGRRGCRSAAEFLEPRLCLTALFTPAPGPPTALGFFPYTAAVGDFNSDGVADLAAVSSFAGTTTLNVLLGNGHGGFAPAPRSPMSVGYGNAVAVGDFAGNGRADLAIADDSNGFGVPGGVRIYLGNGDGTFTFASTVATGNFPVDVAAGDLTGNGRSDLVVSNNMSGTVSVLLSNGDGTFTPAPGSPFPVPGLPFAVAIGDFNGDGKPDIAIGLQQQTKAAVDVFLGNGDGSFSLPGRVTTFSGGALSMAAGDFNGDGKLDLAAIGGTGDDVSVLVNKGEGTFTLARGSPIVAAGTTNANALSIVAGDFTGNGRQDLAVGNLLLANLHKNVSVLLGNGNGTFSSAPGSPEDGLLGAIGTFGGNNEPDLVVGNADSSLSVLLNTSPGGLPTGTLVATFAASLPGSITAGMTAAGRATVSIIAPAGKAVKGSVSVSLFISPDLSLFDATQVTAAVKRNLKLKSGASYALRFPISLLPTAPPGTYHLIAAVEAPDGTTTAVAGPMVTIVKPVIAIHLSKVAASPASVAPGKRLSLGLSLQNTGNVVAFGTAGLTILLSNSASGADSTVVATVPLRVKLKAGQSKNYKVKFRVPRTTAAGAYYLVASLAVGALGDPVAADGIAVSAIPMTVKSGSSS